MFSNTVPKMVPFIG